MREIEKIPSPLRHRSPHPVKLDHQASLTLQTRRHKATQPPQNQQNSNGGCGQPKGGNAKPLKRHQEKDTKRKHWENGGSKKAARGKTAAKQRNHRQSAAMATPSKVLRTPRKPRVPPKSTTWAKHHPKPRWIPDSPPKNATGLQFPSFLPSIGHTLSAPPKRAWKPARPRLGD